MGVNIVNEEKKILDGKDIERIYMYYEHVTVRVDGETYRVPLAEILKLLHLCTFTVDQPRKHKYLHIDKMMLIAYEIEENDSI
jgi:hypothetical protein